jgi:type I restriction enzyme S subunit
MARSTGTSYPAINSTDLSKIKLNIPTKPEQQKIAAFLTAVDNKIGQLSKKQELLGEYKRGLMQKIFSQEIRFKADDGSDFPEWEEKKLRDVLDYEQPTNYIVESTKYDDSFNMPVLTAGKSFILGYTNETQNIFEKFPVIIFDDFTTANKYVDFPFKVKSSAMKILKPKDDFTNIRLVFEFIQMLHFPIGEHKRYWISEYQDLKIPFPNFDEQTKISNFLSSIDNKIEQVGKQLVESKQFKKALLQQMFV